MFIQIKLFKKLMFSKKKNFFLFNRNMSILRKTFFYKNIFIYNSLTWIKYTNTIFNKHYKYGMFAFTRKPFAKPAKRVTKKKR